MWCVYRGPWAVGRGQAGVARRRRQTNARFRQVKGEVEHVELLLLGLGQLVVVLFVHNHVAGRAGECSPAGAYQRRVLAYGWPPAFLPARPRVQAGAAVHSALTFQLNVVLQRNVENVLANLGVALLRPALGVLEDDLDLPVFSGTRSAAAGVTARKVSRVQ